MQLSLHMQILLSLCRFAGMKYDTEQFNVAGRSIKTGLLGELRRCCPTSDQADMFAITSL